MLFSDDWDVDAKGAEAVIGGSRIGSYDSDFLFRVMRKACQIHGLVLHVGLACSFISHSTLRFDTESGLPNQQILVAAHQNSSFRSPKCLIDNKSLYWVRS